MVRSGGGGAGVRAAVVLLVLTASCASSGAVYVANDDLGAYLKLPSGYTAYDHEAVLAAAGIDAAGDGSSVPAGEWIVSFDGSDTPRVDAFMAAVREPPDDPAGFVRVRELRDDERLEYSLVSLRNEVVSAEQVQALGDRVRILSARELFQQGGDGLDVVWSLQLGSEPFLFEQVSLVDDATRRVYVLAIGCSADCYETRSSEIDQIVESWTVMETDA